MDKVQLDELAALRQSRGAEREELRSLMSDRDELQRRRRLADPSSEDWEEAGAALVERERDIADLVDRVLGRRAAAAAAAAPAGPSPRELAVRRLVSIVVESKSFSERERAEAEVELAVASLDEVAAARAVTADDVQRTLREWQSKVSRLWFGAFQDAFLQFARVAFGIDAEPLPRAPVGGPAAAGAGGAGPAAAGAGGAAGGRRGRGSSDEESESDEDIRAQIREAKRRSLRAPVDSEEEDAELQAALAASLRGGVDERLLEVLRERPELRTSHNNAALRVCRTLGLQKCMQFLADSA